jgi:hypothetical protein
MASNKRALSDGTSELESALQRPRTLSPESSLRTIDQFRCASLLPTPDAAPTAPEIHIGRIGSVLVCDNLLSDAECTQLLTNASTTFGFASLEHAYAAEQRQADRLVVVDEALAALLWNRLTPAHKTLSDMAPAPTGFYKRSAALQVGGTCAARSQALTHFPLSPRKLYFRLLEQPGYLRKGLRKTSLRTQGYQPSGGGWGEKESGTELLS